MRIKYLHLHKGEHKTLAISGSQRNSDGTTSDSTAISISFVVTGAQTTLTVDNYISVLSLVAVPKKPTELYEQSVTDFETLGSGDPWTEVGSHGATSSDSDCHVAKPTDSDVVEGFPYVASILMQTAEQVQTSEGKQCTATIVSPYWIATSESCCENAVGGVLDFDDWRGTGESGSGTTGGPSYNFPASKFAGRKRRSFLFNGGRSKRSTDNYDDATCIENGFCKRNGICLIRGGVDLLQAAEDNNVPAKKICLPSQGAIPGKQCWIGGWDNSHGRDRHLIEVNMLSCNPDDDGCDYANHYCVKHSEYSREFQSDGTTPATSEADTDPLTIADNLVCAGYPAYEVAGHTGEHAKTPAMTKGFHLDQGGPIICKEPDGTNPAKLVFVGIATRNMLSKEEGKPGLFARIFEEKAWIESKISTWSDWTSCDHTCVQKRARSCTADDTDCNNGLIKETKKCPDNEMVTTYEGVALDWLADGYKEGCFAQTENKLPQSKIDDGTLKTCTVEISRYRRFAETYEKTSRIINGVDIKDCFHNKIELAHASQAFGNYQRVILKTSKALFMALDGPFEFLESKTVQSRL